MALLSTSIPELRGEMVVYISVGNPSPHGDGRQRIAEDASRECTNPRGEPHWKPRRPPNHQGRSRGTWDHHLRYGTIGLRNVLT